MLADHVLRRASCELLVVVRGALRARLSTPNRGYRDFQEIPVKASPDGEQQRRERGSRKSPRA
jgi:hypothetical protein